MSDRSRTPEQRAALAEALRLAQGDRTNVEGAAACGVRPETWARWLDPKHGPSSAKFSAIAAYLEIDEQVFRAAESAGLGETAYRMRCQDMSWRDIAIEVRAPTEWHAVLWARRYAESRGLVMPEPTGTIAGLDPAGLPRE